MADSQDIEILNYVNAISHQATAGMQRRLREAGLGLVAMEARTLRYIVRHPGCTQTDIVRESGRDKAQIARVVKVLLERGDIHRITNAAGERRQPLNATRKGQGVHRKTEVLRDHVVAELLGDISAQDRATLSKLLGRVLQQQNLP
ncbi:MAG: MarR family transcriptional regulator [Luteimonas sp.]|nr:MarR family transcriptional regulator [Luteimonas sp.]